MKQIKAGDKRPAVFPVVLYHGDASWNAAKSLAELMADLPKGLKPY